MNKVIFLYEKKIDLIKHKLCMNNQTQMKFYSLKLYM